MPIALPKGVELDLRDGHLLVKGPKGELRLQLIDGFEVIVDSDEARIEPRAWRKRDKNFFGLTRALIANMVMGVSQGFEKRLEMIGVGYRAAVQGAKLDVQVGKSHPTLLNIPENIKVSVEKNVQITVTGIDKQKVGQFAADVRSQRKPEPYQGKGIRYLGEHVRRKAGKSAGKGKK